MGSDQDFNYGDAVWEKHGGEFYMDVYGYAYDHAEYAVYRGRMKDTLNKYEKLFWSDMVFEKHLKHKVHLFMREAYLKGVLPCKASESSYGYLRKGSEWTPHWVQLPRGIDVVTRNHAVVRGPPRKLRSCLRQARQLQKDACEASHTPRSTVSEGSESTAASSSEKRHVHFCDARRPGEAGPKSLRSADGGYHYMPMHDEWIYIDRDICGVSLYETPNPDFPDQDFVSSPFAVDFAEELSRLEAANTRTSREDQLVVNRRAYQRQEAELDEALRLAVKQASRYARKARFHRKHREPDSGSTSGRE